MSMGSVSVASPVFGSPGSAIAALAVVVRANRSDLRRLAPAVQATANLLSRILQQSCTDPGRARPVCPATVNAIFASMEARLVKGDSHCAGAITRLPNFDCEPRLGEKRCAAGP